MSRTKVDQAFILAGGRGIRMRRLGEYLPKCALVIYDQPLIIRQIESLRKIGVTDVVVSIGEQYEALVRNLLTPLMAERKVEVHFLVDRELKGAIHALSGARTYLEGKRSFFLLGDIYLEKDDFFSKVLTMPPSHLCLDTYEESDVRTIQAGCNVITKGSEVVRVQEKPMEDKIVGTTCWTGITCLPDDFFAYVDKTAIDLKNAKITHVGHLFQALLENGLSVSHYLEQGETVNLTTPDDLLYANALELRKIHNLRAEEKERIWQKLAALYKKGAAKT